MSLADQTPDDENTNSDTSMRENTNTTHWNDPPTDPSGGVGFLQQAVAAAAAGFWTVSTWAVLEVVVPPRLSFVFHTLPLRELIGMATLVVGSVTVVAVLADAGVLPHVSGGDE